MPAHVTIRGGASVSIPWGARIDGSWYTNAAPSGYYTQQVNPDTGLNYTVTASTSDDAPWSGPIVGDGWDLFESHAQKKVTAIHFGNSGSIANSYDTTAANDCRNRGAFAHYSLGCTAQEILDLANQTDVRSAMTKADTFASQIKTHGHPMLLRPWWEMNGNFGFTWQSNQGVSSAQYVQAWQTLWKIFRARMSGTPLALTTGTDTGNASFFWCANQLGGSSVDPTPWWPGSTYVDWMGFDAYGHGNQSVSSSFDATYTIVSGLNASLPIAIGETGASNYVSWGEPTATPGTASTSPTKAQWITDFFAWLDAHPRVKFFSWFNEDGNPRDPHIEFGPPGDRTAPLRAFRAGISNARYQANAVTSGTYTSGSKIPVPS